MTNLFTLISIFGIFWVSSSFGDNLGSFSSSKNDNKYQDFHHMERHLPRTTFVQGERSLGSAFHEVFIAIHQKNVPQLKQQVLDRATPGNPLYQQWFTFDEIGAIVQNVEAYDKVLEWLQAYDVKISWSAPYKEYIKAYAPISTWEMMLQAQFYQFKDTTHPKEKILHRALEYSIPIELKGHIDSIFHTVQTPPRYKKHYEHRLMKSQQNPTTGQLPYRTNLRLENVYSGSVTVSFIDSLYLVSSNIGSAALNQSVFETSSQYMNPNDLTTFQKTYHLTVQSALNIGGHTTNECTVQEGCDEGNLDIQYIMGMAQKTASIFWYVSDASGDPFVGWIEAVVGEQYPPQSNSISWGEPETAIQSSIVSSWETEAAKLAGRGVTIMVSSGDDGAPSEDSDGTCLCPGTIWPTPIVEYNPSTGYNPSFPATSEWVTAVGATQGPEVNQPEIACQSQEGGLITSGGGFSYYVSRPSYQNQGLDYYFNTASKAHPPASGYNANGRGYPDVALIGVNYQIIVNGEPVDVFGTSCSAPVFAGFVSLVNAARYEAGKSAIGFINPTMYSVGYNNTVGLPNIYNASFNDITKGNNTCCSSQYPALAKCCTTGFSAVKGWDPITGWGSINYPDFAAIFEVAAPYTPSTNSGGSSSSGALSSGAVAGIVILIIAVVAVAVMGYYYYYLRTSRGYPQPQSSVDGTPQSQFVIISPPDSLSGSRPIPATVVYTTQAANPTYGAPVAGRPVRGSTVPTVVGTAAPAKPPRNRM